MTPVEAVARAICVYDGDTPDGRYPIENGPPRWKLYEGDAAAAIAAHTAALAEAGLVIVPREPSEAMSHIGGAMIGDEIPHSWKESNERGALIWRAMIKALKET